MTAMRALRLLLALVVGVLFATAGLARAQGMASIDVADLPPEARTTLRLIAQGGPFPHKRDGITFNNFEKRLPLRQRGYYREYTVATPGLKHRGARRIIAGDGGERFYTEDHYRSFQRIRE